MFRLALGNCFRNTRRTVITALSVFIASFIVIVVMAFMYTVIGNMAENEKLYCLGDIRIRNEKFTKYESLMPVQFYVENLSRTEEEILSVPSVERVTAQTSLYGAVYQDGKTTSTTVIGASADAVFFSDEAVINEGRLPVPGEKEAAVTVRFLSRFGLSVGDTVTLLFSTVDGGSNALKVKITGSVSYLNAEYNSSLVILPIDTLSKAVHMDDGALEILVYLSSGADSARALEEIEEKLSGRGLEVKSYESISLMASMKIVYDIMMDAIIVLFFFIASTLVFNTMMMSVLERRKEIATLVALGFSRGAVILLFVLEGVIISSIGAALAAVLGKVTVTVFHYTGLDLTLFGADAVEGWSFPSILYPELSGEKYILVMIIEIAVAAAAAFLASGRIRRMEVAEELREEA